MASHSTRLKILFLCTGNSCRSQMAEGWARALHDPTLEVWSAGIETHGLNQRAVQVMKESGIDIAHHRSELVDDLLHIPFDFVITVCGHAHESCPVFPSQAKVIHHGFPDPPALARNATNEEEALAPYRRVRDEIQDFISSLPHTLNS